MLKDKNYPDPSLCDTEKPLDTIVDGTLAFRFQSGGAVQRVTGSLYSGLHTLKTSFLQIFHRDETLG